MPVVFNPHVEVSAISENSPSSVIGRGRRHEGITCDVCSKHDFPGRRYKCLICHNYDQCGECWDAKATRSSNHSHTVHHVMQCILTSAAVATYYGSNALETNRTTSFSCPYCGTGGLDETDVLIHLEQRHTEPPQFTVWCPICVTLRGRDTAMLEDLLEHVVHEHTPVDVNQTGQEPRSSVFGPRIGPTPRLSRFGPRLGHRVNLSGSMSASSQEQLRPAFDVQDIPVRVTLPPTGREASGQETFAAPNNVPQLLAHRRLFTTLTRTTPSSTSIDSTPRASVVPDLIQTPRTATTFSWRERLERTLETENAASRPGWSRDGAVGFSFNANVKADAFHGLHSGVPKMHEFTASVLPSNEVAKPSAATSLIDSILLSEDSPIPGPPASNEIKTQNADAKFFVQEILLSTLHSGFLASIGGDLEDLIAFPCPELEDYECNPRLV